MKESATQFALTMDGENADDALTNAAKRNSFSIFGEFFGRRIFSSQVLRFMTWGRDISGQHCSFTATRLRGDCQKRRLHC